MVGRRREEKLEREGERGGSTRGKFFQVGRGGGMSTFLAVGWDFPPRGLPHPHPSSRENPAVITKMEHFAILVNDF